jgi:outer membrane protein OmpA-like peptidoglycan-associated protein
MTTIAPISIAAVISLLWLAGCAGAPQPARIAAAPAAPAVLVPPPPPPPVRPPVMDFDVAVAFTTHNVFSNAPASGTDPIALVIDPLIDGTTGYQSKATQSIQSQIMAVVKRDFPHYTIERLTPEALKSRPRVLIGTFTPVNAQVKPTGERETFWFCLIMLDFQSGKIIARSVARVPMQQADVTPIAVFRDSPAWTVDPDIQAYVANCQGSKVGDAINQQYIDGLLTAALINEAGDAYDEGKYAEALALYRTARRAPFGDQLRVYNGLYLSLYKLKRTAAASAAFRDLIDYGFRKQQLAVKFLFKPGSVRFATDSEFSGNYNAWLQQIAAQTLASQACLQIVGHTTAAGPAALNDSLSLLRAEYVQTRLEDDKPPLKPRLVAAGVGARQNLIGTGRDDATDALDRLVEFKPINPCVAENRAL